uniref:Uncharacterized protein n=1 Tax=Pseudothermotoga hypogea TaxID=57487 RepID=A0A832I4P9_9THEM
MVWRFVDRPDEKSTNEPRVRKFLVALNLLTVISSLILLVYELIPLSVGLIAVSTVLFYFNFESFSETILLVLVYPFSWFFLVVPLRNKRLEGFFKLELPSEIRTTVEEDVLSTLPIKAILAVGSIEEKKKVVRDIVRNVISGLNVEQNMKYLRTLLRDPHMDVALRATMALEEIENHFDRTIALRANPKDFCAHLYFYLKTDIPKGTLREDLEGILRQSLEHLSEHEPLRYEVLYYLTKDEEHLLLGYEKTHDRELLARYLFEKLRKRDYQTLARYLSEVSDLKLFLP